MIDCSSKFFTPEFRSDISAMSEEESRIVSSCISDMRARAATLGGLGFVALAVLAIQELERIDREYGDAT